MQTTTSSKNPQNSGKVWKSLKQKEQIFVHKAGTDPLTEAALKKHNKQNEIFELREFACGPCRYKWWKLVLSTKRVSTCHSCNKKYDALPQEKQFGIGRFICHNQNCNRTFFKYCHALQEYRCKECYEIVGSPYIHPKFSRYRSNKEKMREPLDPTVTLYEPVYEESNQPKYQHGDFPYHLDPGRKKRRECIFNPSTPHESTGSTICTFLTQAEGAGFDIDDESNSSEIVSSSEGSYSSSDDDDDDDNAVDRSKLGSPTNDYSDDERTLISSDLDSQIHPSDVDSEFENDDNDSNFGYKNLHRKRVSNSTDSDENDDETLSEDSLGKISSEASTIQDSGIGTGSNVDTVSCADTVSMTVTAQGM